MLKKRPCECIREVFDQMKDPKHGLITDTTLLDFFTYRGAEITQTGVVIFFRFYASNPSGLTFNEFEYFLTFQRYFCAVKTERMLQGLDDTVSFSTMTEFNYMEDSDLILELVLREIMMFETLYEMTSGLLVYSGGFEAAVRDLYKLFVPSIHIELKANNVVDFMRESSNDYDIDENVKHVIARFDVTNDYVVDFKDFRTFFEKISSTVREEIFEGNLVTLRTSRSGKIGFKRKKII